VVRSESDPNRVDALLPPDLVNQLRVLAAQIEFLL
jgi:phage tail sheath gpL-like